MFIGVLTYINIWYDQQILLQNGQLTAPSVLLTIDSVFLKHYLRDTLSHLRDVGHMTYCAKRLNFLYFRRSTSIHNLIYTRFQFYQKKKIAVICFPWQRLFRISHNLMFEEMTYSTRSSKNKTFNLFKVYGPDFGQNIFFNVCNAILNFFNINQNLSSLPCKQSFRLNFEC